MAPTAEMTRVAVRVWSRTITPRTAPLASSHTSDETFARTSTAPPAASMVGTRRAASCEQPPTG